MRWNSPPAPVGTDPAPGIPENWVIRQLGAADVAGCQTFWERLESQDIRHRFASLQRQVGHLLPAPIGRIGGTAYGAIGDSHAILGIVNLVPLNSASAELAVIVRSDCKRRGIGRALLLDAMRRAVDAGRSLAVGFVATDNRAMLTLARRLAFQCVRWDPHLLEIRRTLPRAGQSLSATA